MAINVFKFTSNMHRMRELNLAISMNALQAAAQVVQEQAKRNVAGGFMGGAFTTGHLMRNIRYRVRRRGMRAWAEVGTHLDYGYYWEVGHRNAFLARALSNADFVWARVQWLKPAFTSTYGKQQTAAMIAIRKTILSKRTLMRLRV